MQRPRRAQLALASSAGLAAVAASFLVSGLGPGFVVLPVDAFLISLVPGAVIAAVIAWVGALGHLFHAVPAVLIVIGLFGSLGYLGLVVNARRGGRLVGSLLGGVLSTLLAGALTEDWGNAFAVGLALAGVVGLAPTGGTAVQPFSVQRRSVLRGTAGAAALLGLGGVVHLLIGDDEPPAPLTRGESTVSSMLSAAEEMELDIEEIDGLVSETHYEVDINPISNPSISTDDWSLSVTGAVETEQEFRYEELQAMSLEHRFATLRCVSDPLNGSQMDTAVWSGVPTAEILSAAQPRSGCECVMLRSADGYYVEVPLIPLREGLLAYGMNGRYLPEKHGYPIRALVPGHWGETDGKWLTEIEVLEEQTDGYWESPPRNWEGTGVVTTIAKLHDARRVGPERVRLAGHAYAGTRGIDRVDVSTDGGETWMEATLSAALPNRDTWRQWRLEYTQRGTETVVVRAVDGTGTVQPRERSEPYPRGASGWVELEVP